MLGNFTFPHSHSGNWKRLEAICQEECAELVRHLEDCVARSASPGGAVVDMKEVVLKACANIFNRYFCAGRRFEYSDPAFCTYVDHFDRIFWEVNTGRLPDFIPALTPLAFVPIFQSKVS